MKYRHLVLYISVLILLICCAGCGETVRGVSKDAHRIGGGVRTIFVAEEE